jgi:regulator of replication initiation timing
MEIVKYHDNQLAQETIEKIATIENNVKRLQDMQSQYKQELIQIMESNGIDLIENDYFRIKFVPEGEVVALDQDKLKKEHEGVYLQCQKVSKRKSSVRITVK